jgi:hypothetical protein
MKMNQLLASIFISTFLFSCGINSYKFNSSQVSIDSKTKNSINSVYISDEHDRTIAHYQIKSNAISKTFSLISFSPDKFNCISGCAHKYRNDRIYSFETLPKGDRQLLPIKLIYKDGKFRKL